MNLLFLLQSTSASGSGMSTIIMMVLMFAVFYFFLIRPQSKKAKEQDNFIANLNVSDAVKQELMQFSPSTYVGMAMKFDQK